MTERRPIRLMVAAISVCFSFLLLWSGTVPGWAVVDEEQLVKEVKSLFATEGTDLKMLGSRRTRPLKSGTPIMEQVRRSWDELSSEAQENLKPFLMRPDDEYGSEQGYAFRSTDEIYLYVVRVDGRTHVAAGGTPRFLIHYTTTAGSPNRVDSSSRAAGFEAFKSRDTGTTEDIPTYVKDVADALANTYGFLYAIFQDADFQSVKPTKIAGSLANEIAVPDGDNRPSNGYAPVHGDPDDTVGGVDVGELYDVYLMNLNTYGLNVSAWLEDEEENNANREYTSYIAMDNDYEGFYVSSDKAVQVTAAHEVFHAAQRTYDPYAELWFMEASAVWMEDELYDTANDYLQYLTTWFSTPYKSLATSDNWHEYGSSLWVKFMSEKYTPSASMSDDEERARIVLQIWRQMDEGSNAFSAIDNVLKTGSDGSAAAYGSTLAEAVTEFWIWNYFTASNNPSSGSTETYYMDDDQDDTGHVAAYPAVAMSRNVNNYPVVSVTPTTGLPRPLGVNYLEFVATSSIPRDLVIDFDGGDGINWQVPLIKIKSDGSVDTSDSISLNTTYRDGAVTIQNFGVGQTYEKVIAVPVYIPSNISSFSPYASGKYTYSATVGYPKLTKGELTQVYNYPNPTMSGSTNIHYNLVRSTSVTVYITDVTGKLVTILVDSEQQDAGDNPQLVDWDGFNERGQEVANGVYFFKIVAASPTGNDDTVRSGRIVVLR
ncbi:MAG: FlgD immunoglobulin-like domain containing protein [bacterium]|nr:FlgD immunoglobulin-like domain containing protein [bacterium]